ncbi:Myrcene synthase, chloroplastic [Apostasia shenzhenica]|uniref:Myrcene synthase, chloroplastic n=1 Tax=Apostasia shenzhenica TaxID=1088818 RepID=A0A2I0A0Y7_9ASPA|nr:Myrcene synthase, chloroplastic [Apostasia shenzhenica]
MMLCLLSCSNYFKLMAALRRTANFKPSIWDDSYIQSLQEYYTEEKYVIRREWLKEQVKFFITKTKSTIEQLELINALGQLGVAYLFELEIKNMLSSISSSIETIITDMEESIDLHGIALLFRLFRVYGDLQGSQLSLKSLVRSIKSESMIFKANIEQDIKGLLSVYEASHLAFEGDDELDEAGEFAAEKLRELRKNSSLDPKLGEQIDYALEIPLHWRVPRFHARWFIDFHSNQKKIDSNLLELAKLDYNRIQSLYKNELKELSRWWKDLGLVCEKLGFARNRPVENYLWALGSAYEPQFWRIRKENFKLNCVVVVIDDIYDVFGTLDELELFTNAIERWIIAPELPEYMKICLLAFFNTVDDIANKILLEKGLHIQLYLRQSCVDVCKAYFKEARWYHGGHNPNLHEYLENAWISIAAIIVLTEAYCLSDDLTAEALQNFKFYPDVVLHSSILIRLYNDLGTLSAEMQRGDVSKSVQCYMNDKNVSESDARKYIKRILIRKHWKALNETLAANPNLLGSFKTGLLGLPQMSQFLYQSGDGFADPNFETHNRVIKFLIEPIPL